jgi:hypothetical protein
LPLILPNRVTPSKHLTRIWFAPIISSAFAKISRFLLLGMRTLTISSGAPPCPGLFSVSTSTPCCPVPGRPASNKKIMISLVYRIFPLSPGQLDRALFIQDHKGTIGSRKEN